MVGVSEKDDGEAKPQSNKGTRVNRRSTRVTGVQVCCVLRAGPAQLRRGAYLAAGRAMPGRMPCVRWRGCWRRLFGPVHGQWSCAGVITIIFNNKEEQDIFDKLMSVRMFDPDPYHHTCPPHAPPRGSGCVRLPARPVQRTRGWIWEMRRTHPGAGELDGARKRGCRHSPPSHGTCLLLLDPFVPLATVTRQEAPV